jgi:hypothetical protein
MAVVNGVFHFEREVNGEIRSTAEGIVREEKHSPFMNHKMEEWAVRGPMG